MLSRVAYPTYVEAHDHAQKYTRCAHIACGVIRDGELISISTNTAAAHAEMNALSHVDTRQTDHVQRQRGCFEEDCTL